MGISALFFDQIPRNSVLIGRMARAAAFHRHTAPMDGFVLASWLHIGFMASYWVSFQVLKILKKRLTFYSSSAVVLDYTSWTKIHDWIHTYQPTLLTSVHLDLQFLCIQNVLEGKKNSRCHHAKVTQTGIALFLTVWVILDYDTYRGWSIIHGPHSSATDLWNRDLWHLIAAAQCH